MSQQKANNKLYLTYLDGVRGLTAFYVVLFHVVADGKELLTPGFSLVNFLRFGHEAVVVFIVLSGFLLALPVARSPQLALKGGQGNFFQRRARRILPAYYMALLMLPVFYLLVEIVKHFSGEGADLARLREIFISGDMLSHLLMLHTLSEEWTFSINPVLWSMATEWWTYFVFALLLLPVWRRFGVYAAALFSIVLGLLPTLFLVLGWPTIYGFPYLAGAFGLGMLSAALIYDLKVATHFSTRRIPLMIIAALLIAAFCWISIAMPKIRLDDATRWITDLLLAGVCAIFIYLTASGTIFEQYTFGLSKGVTRFLELRPLVFLGAFSYSLYLTHLVTWAVLGITLNLAPVQRLFVFSLDPMPIRIFLLIPILLVCAYGFYLLFEKPFLYRRS